MLSRENQEEWRTLAIVEIEMVTSSLT